MNDTARKELFEKEVRAQTFVLIEKNEVLRRTMVRLLKEAGVTNIVEAGSGKEGTMVLTVNRDVGLIVFSDHLPDIESGKYLQYFSQDKKYESTTLVLTSTDSEVSNIQKAIAQGVDGYIIKPFPLHEFKTKLEQAIQMRQKRLALKDLHVKLELNVALMIGKEEMQGTCVELARNECQVVVPEDLGIGSRLQLRLPQIDAEETSWYDPIPGSIATVSRVPQEGGYMLKISFTNKPAKSQGILTLLNHYASQ